MCAIPRTLDSCGEEQESKWEKKKKITKLRQGQWEWEGWNESEINDRIKRGDNFDMEKVDEKGRCTDIFRF